MSRARTRTPRPARPAPRSPWRIDAPEAISPFTDRALCMAAIALGLALGAGLLFMVLGPHRIGDYMAETDFYGAYAGGARLVQQGRLDPARYGVIGPGYEVLLGLAGFVVRDLFLCAELLSLLATLATFALWFLLLRRRADARVAIAAVALYAANAHVFRYGYSATTDAPAVALQAASLWMLLARPRLRSLAGAGVLAAAAFLTRYNAIALLPAGLAVIAAGAAGAQQPWAAPDRAPRPRRIVALGAFALGFFAPVLPWVLYSLAHGSRFSFQLHHNIAYEVFARAKGVPWDDYQKYLQPQFHNLWDVIARDPGAVIGRMLSNVGDHLRDDATKLLGPWTGMFAAAGLVFLAFDRRLGRLWPVMLAGALLFLTLVPAFYSERYSLALVPMYAAFAGVAVGSPRLAFPVAGRVWLKALALAVPFAFAVRDNWRLQAYTLTQLPTEVLEAAATLRAHARPGDKVIARKPHLAWHAGVIAAPFPFADSLPDLARGARQAGARWLYISWPEAETRPAFWPLLDTTGVVPGLTVRRATSPHPAVLYEIGPDFGVVPAWMRNDTLRAWHTVRARLMVDARDPRLHASEGALARALGRIDEARAALDRALERDPNQLDALLEMGAIAHATQDWPLAIDVLEHAVAAHPNNVEARLGLGYAYFGAGRERDAADAWRTVLDATRDPATLRNMSKLFRKLGDTASAARAEDGLARLGVAR